MTNNPPFVKIKNAAKQTGLSEYFLRRGCRSGTIPCVRSGTVYYVNLNELFRILSTKNNF